MRLLEHVFMAVIMGIVIGILGAALLIGRLLLWVAFIALCLAAGCCVLVASFEGVAFLATHGRHYGMTSLAFFGFAAVAFGVIGAAGYVAGAIESATAARRRQRALDRIGGLRLAHDESFGSVGPAFNPAMPIPARTWTAPHPQPRRRAF